MASDADGKSLPSSRRGRGSAGAGHGEDSHRLRVQMGGINNMLCVNGCGFYGTPQWEGRCSQCWRLLQTEEKRSNDFAKNREAFRNFNNFEERRKGKTSSAQSGPLNFLLKKSPSLSGTSGEHSGFSSSASHGNLASTQPGSHSASFSSPHQTLHGQPSSLSPLHLPARTRHRSPESQLARDDFKNFIARYVPTSAAVAIGNCLTQLNDSIYDSHLSPEEISHLVQSCYSSISFYLNNHAGLASAKSRVRPDEVMEEVEKFVCVSHYGRLFAATWFSEEEMQDISLQAHIRQLRWVTNGALEMRVDLNMQAARDELDEAINEINDINARRRVDEKLQCLVRCSKRIFQALKESGAPGSADELVPALIYVLLKGNPPQLQSNLNFIARFGLGHRILSGEPAYIFTTVSGALHFVQNINHTSLNMSKEEFDAYTTGARAPPLKTKNCGCNQALSSLEHSLVRLKKLLEDQKDLEGKISEFERRVSTEEAALCSEIRELSESYPSEAWKKLQDEVAAAEKETAEMCSLTSSFSGSLRLGSSGSGSTRSSEEGEENTNG